jgi:hypothetical protein
MPDLGTDRNEAGVAAQLVGDEALALVAAVEPDLLAEQAGGHTDAEGVVVGHGAVGGHGTRVAVRTLVVTSRSSYPSRRAST